MYLCCIREDDNYNKIIQPSLFKELEWALEELWQFIADNILKTTDKDIREALDKVIYDEDGNLVSKDTATLCELVYTSIDTDKVTVGEWFLCDTAKVLKAIRVEDEFGVAECIIYEID